MKRRETRVFFISSLGVSVKMCLSLAFSCGAVSAHARVTPRVEYFLFLFSDSCFKFLAGMFWSITQGGRSSWDVVKFYYYIFYSDPSSGCCLSKRKINEMVLFLRHLCHLFLSPREKLCQLLLPLVHLWLERAFSAYDRNVNVLYCHMMLTK